MKRRHTTVSIPLPLYKKLEEMIEGSGFTSVSDFVTYILREVVALREKNKRKAGPLTEEELKALEEKLKALGYI
ncbi:MAG: ribbon-helix-helix domain-containing protein [Desulfurococcaceae archaeon]